MAKRTLFSIFSLPPRKPKVFEGQSLTQQHFRDECDVNNIMRKYQKTGILVDPLKAGRGGRPIFGDFSDVQDFHAAQTAIVEAQAAFMSLSSTIRKKFHNDPGELIDFLENEDNRDEAVKLGLIDKPVPVVPPDPGDNSSKIEASPEPPTSKTGKSAPSPT